ncbi:MAG: Mov34/MPN/PAD-1 family protein [Tumebacillaceae bacterium]
MIRLESHVRVAIRAHGQQAFPREACGLVVRKESGQDVVPMQNLAEADDRFQVDPAEMLPYLLKEASIVCFYHSHPQQAAIPSASDRAGYTYSFPHLIYTVCDDEIRGYDVHDGVWVEEHIEENIEEI